MEFLGHSSTEIKKNLKKQTWNPIDLEFENDEKFCEASSKLIQGFKDDCKFIIADQEDEKYFVEVLDYRFVAESNIIRVFPESCRTLVKK